MASNFSKRVVLVYTKPWPSAILRGEQMCLALQGLNVSCSYANILETKNLRRCIVVLIKFCPPKIVDLLRRRENIVVYDAVDYTTEMAIPPSLSGVIATNQASLAIIRSKLTSTTRIKAIHHAHDRYIQPSVDDDSELKIAYVGHNKNSSFLSGKIEQLSVVSLKSDDWRRELAKYNCHFSCRPTSEGTHKSAIKLANAAAAGAFFLTAREPACLELLGEKYPYYIDDPTDLECVLEKIAYLKKTMSTEIGHDVKRQLATLKTRLCPKTIALEYLHFFSELLQHQPERD